jgi:hypothetical protein
LPSTSENALESGNGVLVSITTQQPDLHSPWYVAAANQVSPARRRDDLAL